MKGSFHRRHRRPAAAILRRGRQGHASSSTRSATHAACRCRLKLLRVIETREGASPSARRARFPSTCRHHFPPRTASCSRKEKENRPPFPARTSLLSAETVVTLKPGRRSTDERPRGHPRSSPRISLSILSPRYGPRGRRPFSPEAARAPGEGQVGRATWRPALQRGGANRSRFCPTEIIPQAFGRGRQFKVEMHEMTSFEDGAQAASSATTLTPAHPPAHPRGSVTQGGEARAGRNRNRVLQASCNATAIEAAIFKTEAKSDVKNNAVARPPTAFVAVVPQDHAKKKHYKSSSWSPYTSTLLSLPRDALSAVRATPRRPVDFNQTQLKGFGNCGIGTLLGSM